MLCALCVLILSIIVPENSNPATRYSRGGLYSANPYLVIGTAKANGLQPYAYLQYLLMELPKAESLEAIEALLPGSSNKDQIKI